MSAGVTKEALATSIVNLLITSGQTGQTRLYFLGPQPSKSPGFTETCSSYAEYLVRSRSRQQLLALHLEIISDPTLEDTP